MCGGNQVSEPTPRAGAGQCGLFPKVPEESAEGSPQECRVLSGTQGLPVKDEGYWQSWDASHPAMPGPCSGLGGEVKGKNLRGRQGG